MAKARAPSKVQLKLLRMMQKWSGDLPPDAEEEIGLSGAAFNSVHRALFLSGYMASDNGRDYLTEKGIAILCQQEGRKLAS